MPNVARRSRRLRPSTFGQPDDAAAKAHTEMTLRPQLERSSSLPLLHGVTHKGKVGAPREVVKLCMRAQPWWQMPDQTRREADRFDTQHARACTRGDRLLTHGLGIMPMDVGVAGSFEAALSDIRRARYFADLPLAEDASVVSVTSGAGCSVILASRQPLRTASERRARAAPHSDGASTVDGALTGDAAAGVSTGAPPRAFNLAGSVWAARAVYSDARALFESSDVEQRRFEHDWEVLLQLGLIEQVMGPNGLRSRLAAQGDLAPSRSNLGAPPVGDGDLIPDEIDAVGAILWTHHALLGHLFRWYSSSSCSRRASISAIHLQTINLDRISAKHWRHFVKDFRLADETHCTRAELSGLFARCQDEHDDAKHPATRLAASPKHLSRTQFYAAIVRTAILKYVGLPLMISLIISLIAILIDLTDCTAILKYVGHPLMISLIISLIAILIDLTDCTAILKYVGHPLIATDDLPDDLIDDFPDDLPDDLIDCLPHLY
jgi:hypothetical protein